MDGCFRGYNDGMDVGVREGPGQFLYFWFMQVGGWWYQVPCKGTLEEEQFCGRAVEFSFGTC